VAQIGTLTEDRGAFEGRIRTLQFRLVVELEPVADKRSADSPDYIVWAKDGGDRIAVGSAWKKTVTAGANRGDRFLSLTLDDPSFPAALNCAAFPADGDTWDVVWTRPRQSGRDAA